MPTQYRSVNEALPTLAHLLLTEGKDVPSRVGATKELAPVHFTITDPLQREIVVQGRKANIAAQIAETMWVLSGRNDVDWLSAYLPRAADFSDDGKVWRAGYGPRLRGWSLGVEDHGHPDPYVERNDQMLAVIELLKEDPTTRRAVMSIWDPASDYGDTKDVPCNNWLHFLSRDGKLDLHVAIRSNDLVWGWSGINQFEWSTLLEVVAYYTGLQVGRIHYAVSSLHMYDRHWDKAPTWKPRTVHTQRDRRFNPGETTWDELTAYWFQLEGRIRGLAADRVKCSGPGCTGCVLAKDVSFFPDPMLRSWLWVLGWWWTGDEGWLHGVQDTRLAHAAAVGTGPRKVPAAPQTGAQAASGTGVVDGLPVQWGLGPNATDEAARAVEMQRFTANGNGTRAGAQRAHPSNADRFIREVSDLHIDKDAAYGGSWKKRGELFSILPNVARKSDRLGAGDTSDENQTDTACDLMVYFAKYRTWLEDQMLTGGSAALDSRSDQPGEANALIAAAVYATTLAAQPWTTAELEDELRAGVDKLMVHATNAREDYPWRAAEVDHLLHRATILAMRRWRETPALFARPVEKPKRYCTECGAAEYCHAPGGSRYGSCEGSYDDYQGADHE